MKKLILLACVLLFSNNALAQNATIAGSAAAGSLTGTTLASNVVASSLTSAAGGNFGTAAFLNTGTSGATVARLDGANSWTLGAIFGGNNQIGPGGTAGATPAYVTLNGSSGAGGGAATLLQKNSVFQWGVGHVSSISGSGTSSDWELFNYGTSTAPITVAFADNATTLIGASVFLPNLPTTTAALGAAVCWTTTTGQLQRDTNAGGCLVSSERYKHDIRPLKNSLEEVMAMQPVSFIYNDNVGVTGPQVGFIAEQMSLVDSRLVGLNPDGEAQSVRYMQITALFAGAIQQLKADNDDLHACHENWRCRIFGIKKVAP